MKTNLSGNKRTLSLLSIVAFTAFTAITIYLIPQVYPYIFIRIIAASVFLLYIQGYAFVKMLFPEEGILNAVESLTLSIGSSLALTPIAGLILNILPTGIGQDSSFAFLTLLTLAFAILVQTRKLKPAGNAISPSQALASQTGLNVKDALFIIFAFSSALCLRVYPYALTHMPFSTDGWPFIKTAEILVENSPINLGDAAVFTGSSNYWPGISLFGAVASSLTGLAPMQAMAFYLPIAGALTIPIYYTLVKSVFNSETAIIASLIFGTAFTHAFFTAGVTKETYANPLYVSLLLIFLNKKLSRNQSATIAFTLISVALALTHHLTSVITIAILTCITMAYAIENVKGNPEASAKRAATFTSIFTAAFTLYFCLYACKGFAFPTTSELISAVSYETVFFTAAAYITFKPQTYSTRKTLLYASATAAAAILLFAVTTNITIAPGFTSTVQKHVIPYITPYYILMPFITLGYSHLKRVKASPMPVFWLSTLLALQCYAVFSGTSALNAALWIRTPNFLYPPLSVLAAAGLHQLCTVKSKHWLKIAGKASTTVILAIITLVNCYSLYAAVSLQDKYLGYHWLYRVQEFKAAEWTAMHTSSMVAGDMKAYYLLETYFQLKVNVIEGYKYLAGESLSKPQMLFIYGQMLTNGYVIGFHGVELPEGLIGKACQLSHVYSNGVADVYAG